MLMATNAPFVDFGGRDTRSRAASGQKPTSDGAT
jgi:hypothetical protein